ncbi:Retrovirus-related Pol polyprotein from transposon TNT 1-94 [Vitis vinifera]|uniref:Retrovirus-related Pol polyprotein from transposon TNT 1-94 n=1 Tax=Vitis vinifera TaxID=29760 RepID=A0A438DWT0_VITVI|nr:Retrovirus-related Pol polyprotein from transposon TNT 1-94 [Vitis vinifera]
MRYKGKENIREYIIEMSNLVTRLKALKEERLKQEKIESAHLASTSQGFGTSKKRKRDNKGKQTAVSGTSKQKAFGSYFKSTYSKACVRMNLDKLDFSDFQVCIECIKGPFAKYLMECGIVPQYTMLGTPSQNGVAERRNRTLKDMSITEIQDTPEIPPAQVMEPIKVLEEVTQEPQEPRVQVPLRRSTREMRSTILDDYVVYLQEHEFDMGLEDDPISVSQVKQSSDSEKWIEAMKNEMKSMKDNGVWDLVELPEGVKPIGCKWIFKTKRDSKGNIVRYKALLVTKAHYDLELHQMDVKTRLKKSIYGLKQASRQWYRKFDQVITSFGFKENTVDQCIYLKFSGRKFIILVLYVDDILLASSDVGLLHETKRFLSSKFDMKDLSDASFVLGIQIYRDRSRGILGLSQKAYIDKVLSRFGMSNCAPGDTPVAKGDKFSLHQCPKNEIEKNDMERFPYASAIGSLMYAQVCTHPDITYIVGMLGRYLSNLGMDHWKKAKRVMRYLQRTKDYMLTYHRSSHFEIVGYSDSDFAGCLDSRRSTSGYIFMLAGGAVSWKSVKQTLIASSPWRQNS